MRILLLASIILLSKNALADTPCRKYKDAVRVQTKERILIICENGVLKTSYPVSLGRGGIGKKKEGDMKTPLGQYSLATPRASSYFHVFIPVGYPTAAQAAVGFTGGAVGIHGPFKDLPLPSRLITASDWTKGCIAVGSNQEIEEIAVWVRQHPKVQVIVE